MKRSRSAYSLIECMATLSVLMVVGMASARMFQSIAKIGLDTNENKMTRASIDRLSQVLRSDVKAAETLEVNSNGKVLIAQGQDGQTVDFKIVDETHEIQRQLTASDGSTSVDTFRLNTYCEPTFTRENDLVRLRLTPDDRRNPWIIEVPK